MTTLDPADVVASGTCPKLTCRLLGRRVTVDVGDGADLATVGRVLAAVAATHRPLPHRRTPTLTAAAAVTAAFGGMLVGSAAVGAVGAAAVAVVSVAAVRWASVRVWRRHVRDRLVVHGVALAGGVGALPAACWAAAIAGPYAPGYGDDVASLILGVRERLDAGVVEVVDVLCGAGEGTVAETVAVAAAAVAPGRRCTVTSTTTVDAGRSGRC